MKCFRGLYCFIIIIVVKYVPLQILSKSFKLRFHPRLDSELESLAGGSSDEESDNEWSDIEEEDAIDLKGFDDRPPPLVTKTLPTVSSSAQQSE